jgi:hypothetical protein
MFEPKAPGFELLEKELSELERTGSISLPSLNAFLQKHNLFMKQDDYRALRNLMFKNKKWKMVRVYDYCIVKRGKKK